MAITLAVSSTAQTINQVTVTSTSVAGLKPQKRTFSLTGVMGTAILPGDAVSIWGSNDGGATFQPLRQNGAPVQLNFQYPEIVIDDCCDTYGTQRVSVARGSTLAAVGLNGESTGIIASPAWVRGGNAGFGPTGVLGTTDTAILSIIAESKEIVNADGTNLLIGKPDAFIPGNSLQLYAGAGGAVFIVDNSGSISISTDAGPLIIDSTAGGPVSVGATFPFDHTTALGSTTGISPTSIRAGTGALALTRNGITWGWPNADAVGSLTSNGLGALSFVPPVKATFSAAASLTNNATQFVPPSGLATSLTLNYGVLQANVGAVSRFFIDYIGDAANVASQTIAAAWLKNGVAIGGAAIALIPTTAGHHAANVVLGTPVALVAGDILTMTITPSAALTAVCTNVLGAAS